MLYIDAPPKTTRLEGFFGWLFQIPKNKVFCRWVGLVGSYRPIGFRLRVGFGSLLGWFVCVDGGVAQWVGDSMVDQQPDRQLIRKSAAPCFSFTASCAKGICSFERRASPSESCGMKLSDS